MKCSCYKIKYLHAKCSNVDTCNLGVTNILNLAIIVEHLRLFCRTLIERLLSNICDYSEPFDY